MALGGAILLSLLAVSCTAGYQPKQGRGEPSASISISTGPSLLPAVPLPCDGSFACRGIDYHVKIHHLLIGPGSYAGTGTVYGLDWPEDIAGTYSAEPGGKVWHNQEGVEIDLTPPITTLANAGKFEIELVGSTLPRQP